jgi:hypothetical protein
LARNRLVGSGRGQILGERSAPQKFVGYGSLADFLADLIAFARNVATQGSRNPRNPTDANSRSLNSSTPIKYEWINLINFYMSMKVALNQ